MDGLNDSSDINSQQMHNRHGINGNRKKRILNQAPKTFDNNNTVIHDPDIVNFTPGVDNDFMKSIEQCGDFIPLPPPNQAFSKKVSSGANTHSLDRTS